MIMAESRRLLVDTHRLNSLKGVNQVLPLLNDEAHYLRRVLRLENSALVDVVDGLGRLWHASFEYGDRLRLLTGYELPAEEKLQRYPLVGLAVVIPRRGMDTALRMSCEIGLDNFQPLISERRVPQGMNRTLRWQSIFKEAIQQSERLWLPEIQGSINASDFWRISSKKTSCAIATTRQDGLEDIKKWIQKLNSDVEQIWVAIGPEGGWTSSEESMAKTEGWFPVSLGDSILRTSTAAVVATQEMVSWRGHFSSS